MVATVTEMFISFKTTFGCGIDKQCPSAFYRDSQTQSANLSENDSPLFCSLTHFLQMVYTLRIGCIRCQFNMPLNQQSCGQLYLLEITMINTNSMISQNHRDK